MEKQQRWCWWLVWCVDDFSNALARANCVLVKLINFDWPNKIPFCDSSLRFLSRGYSTSVSRLLVSLTHDVDDEDFDWEEALTSSYMAGEQEHARTTKKQKQQSAANHQPPWHHRR